MTSCNDLDSRLASLKADEARLAAMQAQIDACCAKSDTIRNLANQALGILNPLAPVVSGLLAKVADIISSVSALNVALRTLEYLGARLDAIENGLSQQGNSLSDLFGRFAALKSLVQRELE